MAALSFGHSFNTNYVSTHKKLDQIKKTPRIVVPCCCQSRVPLSLKTKKEEKVENDNKGLKFMVSLEKVKKGLKESLSPKRKGDWKDLVLMSLSFAVYVYISQKLVCAYCVWTSMLNQW